MSAIEERESDFEIDGCSKSVTFAGIPRIPVTVSFITGKLISAIYFLRYGLSSPPAGY